MNELEEIKSRLDIVEYIGKYVPLKQAGRNFKGVCPFHNEKTPSFMVSSDKQIFHCFGCGKGGDIVSFAMEIEGVDFPTALKELADKAGVKLPEKGNYKKEPTDKLLDINNQACEIYERELWKPENKEVLDYLVRRGLTLDTIKMFRLGYAPKSGDVVVNELTQIGQTKTDLIRSGVAKERNGKFLDQFFGRITFPITNPSGKVVAFTARVLDDSQPKYINTPETPVYHKSEILFNFDKAKEQVRKQDHIIIVEGQMDAIFSFQAGVKNVVASSGTALTERQLDLIKRFTKNVKMAFDVDNAGQLATKRAVELAWEREFNIKVISVPEGKDPADLVNSDPKKWVDACRKAKYVVDYIFDSTWAKYNLANILDKKKATRELLAWVRKLPDPVEHEHYLRVISEKVGVSVGALEDALAKIKEPPAKRDEFKAPPKETKQKKLTNQLEKHTLSLLFLVPGYVDFFFSRLTKEDFTDPGYAEIVVSLSDYFTFHKDLDLKKWQESLASEMAEAVNVLTLEAEDSHIDASDDLLAEEIFYSVNRLKKESLARAMKTVRLEIETAERDSDSEKLKTALTSFQKLIDEEKKL